MKFARSILPFLVALQAVPALGERVALGEDTLELSAPPGFCGLVRASSRELQAIELQERLNAGQNLVLAVSVPCGELAEFRKEVRSAFTQQGLWLAQAPDGKPMLLPPGVDRAALIRRMSEVAGSGKLDVSSAVDRLRSEGVATEQMAITHFGRDELAAYFKFDSVTSDKRVAGISAMTTLGRRPVSFQLYRIVEGDPPHRELADIVRRVIVASSVANTPGTSRTEGLFDDIGPDEGFDLGHTIERFLERILNAGISGGFLGAGLAIVFGGLSFALGLFRRKPKPGASDISSEARTVVVKASTSHDPVLNWKVAKGDLLGHIVDTKGQPIGEVRADRDGWFTVQKSPS